MRFISCIKASIYCMLLIGFLSNKAHAELDPRLRVIGTVALYGTAGGSLLGLATLAFEGGGRNIAKGASLGLYAGLIFGGFIVISHYQAKNKPNFNAGEYPDDGESPYADEEYEDDGAAAGGAEYWRHLPPNRGWWEKKSIGKRKSRTPPIYLNLLKLQF
jgi:hypothetical protein